MVSGKGWAASRLWTPGAGKAVKSKKQLASKSEKSGCLFPSSPPTLSLHQMSTGTCQNACHPPGSLPAGLRHSILWGKPFASFPALPASQSFSAEPATPRMLKRHLCSYLSILLSTLSLTYSLYIAGMLFWLWIAGLQRVHWKPVEWEPRQGGIAPEELQQEGNINNSWLNKAQQNSAFLSNRQGIPISPSCSRHYIVELICYQEKYHVKGHLQTIPLSC